MSKKYYGRVVLIHGAEYRKRDRGTNMRRLAPSFRAAGFCTIIPTYGFLPALLLGLFPWLDDRIAESLAGFIEPNDILVGHSNGATLSYLISKRIPVRGAVLINAALETDRIPNAKFVHVYYNSGDVVTKLSEWLPFHPWGKMGGYGYNGADKRVRNFDQANTPGLPALDGHSDVFSVGKCRPWARFMAESCLRDVLALGDDHERLF
jgi:pimeloyl-ACP methyl ester carboxylesterase